MLIKFISYLCDIKEQQLHWEFFPEFGLTGTHSQTHWKFIYVNAVGRLETEIHSAGLQTDSDGKMRRKFVSLPENETFISFKH